MAFHINIDIISIIAELYTEDITQLFLNDEEIAEIRIESGIRQGCNGSPSLF